MQPLGTLRQSGHYFSKALSAWAQAGSTQVIKLLLASTDKHLVICSYALEAYVNSYLWLTYSYRFGLVGALLHV